MSFDVGINLFFHRRGLCGNALFEQNAQNCQDIFLNNFVLQILYCRFESRIRLARRRLLRKRSPATAGKLSSNAAGTDLTKRICPRNNENHERERSLSLEIFASFRARRAVASRGWVFSGQNYYPARGRGTGVGRGGRRTEKTNRPSRCIDCMRKRIGLAAKSSARRLKSIGQKGSQIKFEPLFPSPARESLRSCLL